MTAPELHSYTNKLRNSHSVFGMRATGQHPVDTGNTSGALWSGVELGPHAADKLNRFNAEVGERQQVHILLIASTQPTDNALAVIEGWGGLNKNELAVFIGVVDGRIAWSSVKSWMDNSSMADAVRDELMIAGEPDIDRILEILRKHLGKWRRKQFSDFDYLPMTVSPWSWCILMGQSLVSLGIMISVYIYGHLKACNPLWVSEQRKLKR